MNPWHAVTTGNPDPTIDHRMTLAPRPRTLAETGLGEDLLTACVLRHLYQTGAQNLNELVQRVKLPGNILEPLVTRLRRLAQIQAFSAQAGEAAPRFGLTEQGRAAALAAFSQSGYVGPAPVALADYARIVRAQSLQGVGASKCDMQRAFSQVVIDATLLDQLGPAMHSGRPILVYGGAGTGKTYICGKLAQLSQDPVLIPFAIDIGGSILQVYDPAQHRQVDFAINETGLSLEGTYDSRFALCHRPVAVTGGELTLDMLEVDYDRGANVSIAPVQFKANNGVYIIDDLGRQRVSPVDLFNRWIVPMEERRDFLTLPSGARFEVPFDLVLIFSTNLDPAELADEAFLRRLGYKIRFQPATEEYRRIWEQVCGERNVVIEPALLDSVLARYTQEHRNMLPCHPRDLIGLMLDQLAYAADEIETRLTLRHLELAWQSYFVSAR